MTSSTLGPFYPSAVVQANFAGPANTWVNPNNALAAPDTVNATVGVGAPNAMAKYLTFTGFGVTIPPGAVITGFELFIRCQNTGGSVVLSHVELLKNGVLVGTNHSSGADSIPATLTDTNYGGLGDFFGGQKTDWRAPDVGDLAGFGVGLLFQHVAGSGSVALDGVGLEVFINTPTQSEATRNFMGMLRSARNFLSTGL